MSGDSRARCFGTAFCGKCPNLGSKCKGCAAEDHVDGEPRYHIEALGERTELGTDAWLERQRPGWALMMR